MKRLWFIAAVVAACLTVYAARGPWIPFWLKSEVISVLADWRDAGLSCDRPEVGMPGPAVDWYCRRTFAGVEVRARLTADAHGVQSIVAGVPATTSGEDAAKAFVGLVEATSLFRAAKTDIKNWLLESQAADGVMPSPDPSAIGRASVSRDSSDSHPVLYLTPAGSSILLAQ